jgi:NAD+ kinase
MQRSLMLFEVLVLRSMAVFYHSQKSSAISEARWIARELEQREVDVCVGDGWDADVVLSAAAGRDMVVALGGDGTIIHVARLVAPLAIPVAGVNLGRVGFLAEMTPEALHAHIEAIAAGRFWVESRSMLQVDLVSADSTEQFLCLNEVAIARGLLPRAVHVRVHLGGDPFTTYTADAVLVATATGSTAYSLAAGGPILYPEASEFMLTPVAPHLHIGRSVVLPPDMTVALQLVTDRAAVLSVDGTDERHVTESHRVCVKRSEVVARFARFGSSNYFYTAIAHRLH